MTNELKNYLTNSELTTYLNTDSKPLRLKLTVAAEERRNQNLKHQKTKKY